MAGGTLEVMEEKQRSSFIGSFPSLTLTTYPNKKVAMHRY